MDKRVLRERMRRKQRQLRRRKLMRLGTYAAALVLAVVFVIRGIILPIVHRIGGSGTSQPAQVQAQIQPDAEVAAAESDSDIAIRQPLRDVSKASQMTPGWHEDENGKWYENTDKTYFSGGLQEIDGATYCFDDDGYIQTGWVTKGAKDYYFNDDGSYNPSEKRPMLALTFDDGPGQYTEDLLNCLEENGAHATFFMVGQNVSEYAEAVQHMVRIGCELGSHSWDHSDLVYLDLESVARQYSDTDNALIQACGQPATVARAPYGSYNQDVIDTVAKPFFMWSLDTMDWSNLNVEMDYDAVMNGDLTDGSIILMHDIHEPSVEAAKKIIPDLIARGYKLVTVSELAANRDVDLQYASYSDFWPSSLANGLVAGYKGDPSTLDTGGSSPEEGDYADGSGDFTDGEEDFSEGDYSEEDYSEEDYSEEDYSDEEYSDEEYYGEEEY